MKRLLLFLIIPFLFAATWNSPTMTSNTTPSPYVVSANIEYIGHPAWAAMDGSASYWDSYPDSGAFVWWQLYMGAGGTPVIVTALTIQNYIHLGFNSFIFQGSNDGSGWTPLYSGSCADSADVQSFAIPNTNAYMYYRITGVTGYGASEVSVREITMSAIAKTNALFFAQ